MKKQFDVIKTDVLVIGAGGAGIRAAIESKNLGSDVILLGKEVLGCAHTGMAMGGMNAALVPPATPEFHGKITLEGGYFINNYRIVKAFVEEMPDRIRDLEKYGVIFDRKDDGDFYVWAGPKQKYPLNVCVGDYTGREMMQGLVDEARKLNIKYTDEFFISKLLTKNSKVIGAIGIDLKKSNLRVFLAKSTIVATGGAGRMYEVTTNANSNTGDGYAMAIDVGVELIDMEMTQFHPTGMAYPQSSRGVLVTEKVRAHGGILRNKNGERFMSKYFPKEMELAKRDEVSRSIYQEVAEGRGTAHHAVYLYVNHWKKEEILDKIPDVYEQYRNVGVDITKEPMEIYPSMHHMMGGMKIDEWGRTRKEGLFACGEVTGGVHGANRLGGNSIAEGQVFGKRSGMVASEYANKTKLEIVLEKDIRSEEEKLRKLLEKKEGYFPQEIEKKLKKVMWEKVGIYRDEKMLKEAQKEIEILKKDIQNLRVRTSEKERNRDLQDCFEVVNMIKTAESVVAAALVRKESRGAHTRTDYPQTSKEWQKNIAITMNNGKLKIQILPVVKPITVSVKVRRKKSTSRSPAYFQTFEVPYDKGMTVLDLIQYIQTHLDSTLAYRFECRQGICGTCGVMYNSRPVLACSTQIQSHEKELLLEPLHNFPVEKDLIVDLKPILIKFKKIKPFLDRMKEVKINKNEANKSKPFRKCIECGCCIAGSDTFAKNRDILSPMDLVKIARFVSDPRDGIDRKTIAIKAGALKYSKEELLRLTNMCPRQIPIFKAGELLK